MFTLPFLGMKMAESILRQTTSCRDLSCNFKLGLAAPCGKGNRYSAAQQSHNSISI